MTIPFDKQIDALFQCLPANSRSDIAKKMAAKLRCRYTNSMVSTVLAYLRRNEEHYGFTVPHIKKGKDGDEKMYFAVLIEKGREPNLNSEHEDAMRAGAISTIDHGASCLRNESAALSAAAKFIPSRTGQTMARSLARRLRTLVEDLNDLALMLKDDEAA